MIECVARDLFSVDKNIVASRCTRIEPQLLQYVLHHKHIAVEGEIHICIGGYIREHYIAFVGIYATATALTPVHLNSIGATIAGINLGIYQLVASEYHSWVHLPHKEIVGRR